jgi:hypothetical protein
MGDADCNNTVDENDGLAVIGAFAGLGPVGCPEPADVNCDQAIDPKDALAIFKYAADISSASAGCTPIGQPLTG